MKSETLQEIKDTFKTVVRQQVAKGGKVRWGEAESLAVIEALVDVLVSNEDAQADGFDAIRTNVGQVVNPSAFAQTLEKLPAVGFDEKGQPLAGGTFPHPARIVRPKRGTGGSRGASDL